jgi:hypothetical protein
VVEVISVLLLQRQALMKVQLLVLVVQQIQRMMKKELLVVLKLLDDSVNVVNVL